MMKKRSVCIIILLTAISLFAVNTNAALIDNGNGTITDTDRGIMWLQDANYAKGIVSEDGSTDYFFASSWAAQLNFAGYDDWRLPSGLNSDGSGPCSAFSCKDSEMGHLYYIELQNPKYGPIENTAPFISLINKILTISSY
jgi:hypothetical protein